MIYIDTTKI